MQRLLSYNTNYQRYKINICMSLTMCSRPLPSVSDTHVPRYTEMLIKTLLVTSLSVASVVIFICLSIIGYT